MAVASADAPASSTTRMSIDASPEKSLGGSNRNPSKARFTASTPPLNTNEDEFGGHAPSPSAVAIFMPTGFAARSNLPVLATKSRDTSSASASVTTMPLTEISASSSPFQNMSPRNDGFAFVGETRTEHVASDIPREVPFNSVKPVSSKRMACVPRFAPLYTSSCEATILLSEAGELNTKDVGVATDRRESVPFRMDTTDGEDHASFMTG
mmetsp:Transcript_17232/g.49179  ORF Transcript_17232/g.49179 Transcript_17232/m.49179 type:complete len:210 (+) Transcript_17232:12088-12717(+)